MKMKYGILPFERIRNLRIDNNFTQKDIAKILNIKQNTYSQYEIGTLRYPVDVLIKLSLHYNVSIDYLVGITDTKEPYPRKKQ